MADYVTLGEIYQQPEMWKKTYEIVASQREELNAFIAPCSGKGHKTRVIFTGGGTSNYIGDVIAQYLNYTSGASYEFCSYPSTTIVSNPYEYLLDEDTILVNFARSGDSPESVASVELANQLLPHVRHLFITCAKDGHLARKAQVLDNAYALVLDEKTLDQGFAMTSSASSMLLSALMVFDQKFSSTWVDALAKLGEVALSASDKLDSLVAKDFDRVVYLGSGALSYMTKESRLKLLELTAGKIAAMYDNTAGFRHGPKSFLDEKTIVFSYLSNNAYTAQYDLDMYHEIEGEGVVQALVGIGPSAYKESSFAFDVNEDIPDAYLSVVYLILAQLFAYKTAIKIHNDVDNPSASGTVNRVVKGVIIHPYTN